jgi:hypothetical protein
MKAEQDVPSEDDCHDINRMTRGIRDEGVYSPRSIIVPKNGNSMLSWRIDLLEYLQVLKARAF